MSALNKNFITGTKSELAANKDRCETFSLYGGAIYGILLRSLGSKKLSEEILVKVFLQADELRAQRASDAPICFCELLKISRSILSNATLSPAIDKEVNDQTLDGLLSNSLLPVEDRYSLGREIREKLISFRK